MNKHRIPSKDEIEDALRAAIKAVRDEFSEDLNVSERALTHRLAVHLEFSSKGLFAGWHIDCEYNRDGHDPKRLGLGEPKTTDDGRGSLVLPDVIVHRRRESRADANLLVIEVKRAREGTSEQDLEYDLNKLRAYHQQLRYRYACFVTFEPDHNIEWICPV